LNISDLDHDRRPADRRVDWSGVECGLRALASPR